ncbi:YkgJ family cysteine cluster protein [archaeon]|nr:YkgJ family cysteine cluster protein [archaeon]
MFEKNQEIHFACTQCGKCCDKPPRVNFYEMLELADKFIFQTAHHTTISYADKPLEKKMCEHYQIIGHTIMMPELDASLFYFIDFIPISLISNKACPQLKDNLCQIYGERPATCRISPFSAYYDETEQWKTVNFFKKNTETHNWKCSFDEKEPIIYKNNDIYSHSHNAIYNQEITHIRNITDKYIEFLSTQGDLKKNNHFKALFDAMQKNALVITDVIFMLQVGLQNNLISDDLAIRFINKQIILIEKELNSAKTLKNKDDLQTSRLYKRILEDYKKVLSTNFFTQENKENFDIIN